MTYRFAAPLACLLVLGLLTGSDRLAAQTPALAPIQIPVSGQLLNADGSPRTGVANLMVSLYDNATDTAPRWIELQPNVALDAQGRYAINFGSTFETGLPLDLFVTTTARWVGVGVEGEQEPPASSRFMLLMVPYAARAASADALGGNPATSFVTSTNLGEQVRTVLQEDGVVTPAAIQGTLNRVQKGDGAAGTIDAAITEIGGNVGIGTTFPFSRFHILDNTESEFRLQISGGALAVVRGVVGAADIGSFSNHPLRLFANSQEMIRVSPDGNVGIGTSIPDNKLHVAGNTRIDGNVTASGNLAAKYQDVAEWVPASEPLEAGTIVVIDTTQTNRVSASRRAFDTRVAGAISPQPGLVLGEAGEGKVLVAQSGRVRVKVDATFGAIQPGDLLVTSSTQGHARRATSRNAKPGTVIGKALEALPNGRGEILALLTLQ